MPSGRGMGAGWRAGARFIKRLLRRQRKLILDSHSTSATMDEFKSGWFSEVDETYLPGQAMSLEVEEILHKEKSQFQDILIFKRYQHDSVVVGVHAAGIYLFMHIQCMHWIHE